MSDEPTLAERIAAANTLLAPYAVPHQGHRGRAHPEPDDEMRFPFQRDRARIIHTQAFRRLQGKTQVFVAGEGDHYRTRLTHTMEVCQISRDIARSLGLNEDVTECIALAHDIGHPPFGHAGESALHTWMAKNGGRFEHNEQAHRIFTLLAKHGSLFPGLNLQKEILDGLLKHSPAPLPLTLEAVVVDLADEIAYCAHDCEDGLRADLFPEKKLLRLPIAREAEKRAKDRGTSLQGALIRLSVTDLLRETTDRLHASGIVSLDDVESAKTPLVGFSADMREQITSVRAFLSEHFYNHPHVRRMAENGQRVITQLCDSYLSAPPESILELHRRTGGTIAEAVRDFVAGMTDTFANEQARARGISLGGP